jgi:hypothetical protein
MLTRFSTKQRVSFQCVKDTTLGAYTLTMGESLRAISDGMGKFHLITSWSDGQSIGSFTAKTINELAGEILVQ